MATANDFTPGTDIQHKGNSKRRGVVIGNKVSDGDQVIAVEWNDGSLCKVNVNDIQVCLSLEEEFRQAQNTVNEKLQEAAKLIKEASSLAGMYGKDLRSWDSDGEDYLFDQGLLEDAMEDAGWNTSSWHC